MSSMCTHHVHAQCVHTLCVHTHSVCTHHEQHVRMHMLFMMLTNLSREQLIGAQLLSKYRLST